MFLSQFLFLLMISKVLYCQTVLDLLKDNKIALIFPKGKPLTPLLTNLSAPKLPRLFRNTKAPNCIKSSQFSGLCEEDEEYNDALEKTFKEALTRSNINPELLENGLLTDEVQIEPEIGIRTRTEFISEDPVCAATEKIIYPKRGVTMNSEWVFLLNLESERIQQGIRVEQCVKENEACSVSGDETVCRQKFIYKKMLTMDGNGTHVIPESILVPSCCVCYRKTILPRISARKPILPNDFKSITTPAVNGSFAAISLEPKIESNNSVRNSSGDNFASEKELSDTLEESLNDTLTL